MKTGLFRDSFLEDPWVELLNGKRSVGGKSQGPTGEDRLKEDSEGEIDLGEEFEEGLNSRNKNGKDINLGDRIAEAAGRA
jgi:hypothetical protein